MPVLYEVLKACSSSLPEAFCVANKRLFQEEEHLQKLALRLTQFKKEGVPDSFPLPHFDVECTPSLSNAYSFFVEPLLKWEERSQECSSELVDSFAKAMNEAGMESLLILLGQRFTPASLKDHQAIPPSRERLIKTATAVYDQGLTVGARAWSKHAHRSEDQFWGEVKGSTEKKNETALEIILRILDNTTWWNIFGHYKHDIVYEARLSSGQGVRWGKSGDTFIGFLEPFLNEEE